MNDTSVDTPPEVFHTPNLKYFEDVLDIRNIFKTVLFVSIETKFEVFEE